MSQRETVPPSPMADAVETLVRLMHGEEPHVALLAASKLLDLAMWAARSNAAEAVRLLKLLSEAMTR